MPTTTRKLPAAMRRLLLDALTLGYPLGAAQSRLDNAPDAAVAWQTQSMLDDYADFDARMSFADAA